MINTIHKGDDTGAFGNNFITININNPLDYPISKAEFIINNGCPKIPPFANPNFPIAINLTSEQTAKLRDGVNIGQLKVWDSENRGMLCKGTLKFYVENGVIINGCQC